MPAVEAMRFLQMNYLDLLNSLAGNYRRRDGAGCARVGRLRTARRGFARHRRRWICYFAAAPILLLPQNATLFGGMLVITPLTSLFKIICLALAFFHRSFARERAKSLRNPGEYLAILLLATVGLMLLVGSEELLMIFIGLELLGLSLYVMTAFDKTRHPRGRSGPEIFFVWQHGERVHSFWNQPDLWNDGHDGPGNHRGKNF